jgi:hypothetical protein
MQTALAGVPETYLPMPSGIATTILDGRPEYYYTELPPPDPYPPTPIWEGGEGWNPGLLPTPETPPSERTPYAPILERSFLN